MFYYDRELTYPTNIVIQLGDFPNSVNLRLLEENFDRILNDYFERPNCFLNGREKFVVLSRYKERRTLQDIAKEINLTRERVRQIEVSALWKIKKVKNIFCDDFDEYLQVQNQYLEKKQELYNKINELETLIQNVDFLLNNDETTMKDIKVFVEKFKEVDQSFVLKNYNIVDLDLTVRSYNCLKRAGIDTVEKLSQLTIKNLLKIRNLGKKSAKEILEKLRELNIELREE